MKVEMVNGDWGISEIIKTGATVQMQIGQKQGDLRVANQDGQIGPPPMESLPPLIR